MTRVVQRLACAGAMLMLGASLPAAAVAQARPPAGAANAAGAVQGQLLGVTAVSPASAWAVGHRCVPNCASLSQTAATLIRRWNGRAWSTVPSPNPGADWNYLNSVSASSAKDAWAVGYDSLRLNANTEISGTLIVHWNGKAWTKAPSPNPGTSDNELLGISAVSAANAWAVGAYLNTTGVHQPLILHWNGKAWNRVPSPNISRNASVLLAVRAVSATSAWAVGGSVNTAGTAEDTLILHWNGKAWTKVPSPSPGSVLNGLGGVSAVSATSAWAVGAYCGSVPGCGQDPSVDHTLILHWNGRAWARVAGPGRGDLAAVSIAAATSTWAIGSYCVSACGHNSEVDHTLILHWNGRAWSTVAGPGPGVNHLTSVAAASAASAWAVGYSGSSSPHPLILHWNGKAWSVQ